ncbi:MAG: toll/interleukin-1 receptor domain-containing protein [Chitinophagaceae bacterium]
MTLTEYTLASFKLGTTLQFLEWKVYQGGYASFRKDLLKNLALIGLTRDLPREFPDFDLISGTLRDEIITHLKTERSRLGGDIFAYTFFYLGYTPFRLIASAGFGNAEDYEILLTNLVLLLHDLDIQAELKNIKKEIDLETKWLSEQGALNNGDLPAKDVASASMRLQSKIFSLISIVERTEDVQFDAPPFYSVFISYSTKDEAFCQALYNSLKNVGIRVWFAPINMKAGQKIHQQVSDAIRQYDKLLLVLSEASIESGWVGTEIFAARDREIREGKQLLFPIRLSSFDVIQKWQAFDADTGKDLAREIRQYYIPDFSNWLHPETYEVNLQKLLESLTLEHKKMAG